MSEINTFSYIDGKIIIVTKTKITIINQYCFT